MSFIAGVLREVENRAVLLLRVEPAEAEVVWVSGFDDDLHLQIGDVEVVGVEDRQHERIWVSARGEERSRSDEGGNAGRDGKKGELHGSERKRESFSGDGTAVGMVVVMVDRWNR